MSSSRPPVKTLFVLGAGASKAFGLPTANELRDLMINDACSPPSAGPDRDTPEAQRHERSRAAAFATHLRSSGQASIDAFLEKRKEFRDIGLFNIARFLLPAQDRAIGRHAVCTDWLRWIFLKCLNSQTQLETGAVGFITFNYDITLEAGLAFMIGASFSLAIPQAVEIVRALPIVHPYGQLDIDVLGALARPGHAGDRKPHEFVDAGRTIRIMGDRVEGPVDRIEAACTLFEQAAQVVFLGFGYDDTNLRRIGIECLSDESTPRVKRISGTAFGLHRAEREVVASTLRMTHNTLGLSTQGCEEFLRDQVADWSLT
ncbi:MAG: hypothetical protein ACKVS8_12015 [Phycisphaerales bacterium]